MEFRQKNVLDGVAEADTAEVRKVLLTQADTLSKDIERKRRELVEAREAGARFKEAADIDLDVYANEIKRLVKEDRKEAQKLFGDLIARIELKGHTRHDGRFVKATMRDGSAWSWSLGRPELSMEALDGERIGMSPRVVKRAFESVGLDPSLLEG